MAIKIKQTVEMFVAELQGVSVTGTECSVKMHGGFQAPILSLLRLPRSGSYPIRTSSDAGLADNAAAALAVRTGRSIEEAGEHPRAKLARSASGTIRSRMSPSPFTMRSQQRPSWLGTKSTRG
jgi:hypothetical protein